MEQSETVGEDILATLRRRSPSAAFVTEVGASLTPAPARELLERAISELAEQRCVLLVDYPVPDVHLAGADLRIVAEVTDLNGEAAAQVAADALWSSWLRAFLATHRCQ